MYASVGDRIVITAHHAGEAERDCGVLKVAPDGGPPYVVRWGDTGHEAFFSQSVQHFEHAEP